MPDPTNRPRKRAKPSPINRKTWSFFPTADDRRRMRDALRRLPRGTKLSAVIRAAVQSYAAQLEARGVERPTKPKGTGLLRTGRLR